MKKLFKTIISLLIVLATCFTLTACGTTIKTIKKTENTATGKYAGQTIILHTNDVHGAIAGYSYLPDLKTSIEAEGGTVILVDAGDYTSGNIYVSVSKGESAITLMNQVGYDLATFGNHEFDFGFAQLQSNLTKANFNIICSDIEKDGKTIYDSEIIYQVGSLKIGFFALSTPEIQTKVVPSLIEGLEFFEKEELYKRAQEEADKLNKVCDIVVCLSHLGIDDESIGNRSIDVMENTTGIDFVIDGHSHSVIANGDKKDGLQQTGTAFENIGLIAIDNKTKQIVEAKLIPTEALTQDEDVLAIANNIIATVDADFGATFATTEYKLIGEKPIVRTQETNLTNLIADALVWFVKNETTLEVDDEHILTVINGGGIRATIEPGDISKSTIKTVLPFGNTVAVYYITGAELLEALEASTFATPEANGGFPQIANMKIVVDTTIPYDAGSEYPGSTYCAPNSIKRVTIVEINGKEFDPTATYAVVTNNFCGSGGDTYYAFRRAYDAGKGFDTSIPMDEAVVNYINYELGGVIPEKYAEPQGRIIIK